MTRARLIDTGLTPARELPSSVENYFEYFTEIEECFRRCRGTPTLLSTLDWALIDAWREAGIPLNAVTTGIERAFEKRSRRPERFRRINSLAYCTQAVLEAAGEMQAGVQDSARRPAPRGGDPAPFTLDQLHSYFRGNSGLLRNAARNCSLRSESAAERVLAEDLDGAAAALDALADETRETPADIQPLEMRLASLEEKLSASVVRACPADRLMELRRDVERGVAPYRGKMTGAQLESLDRQYLKRRLYEHYGVPRLSLFYLGL